MNPIRYAGVIAFVDWVSRTHPEVRSLHDMPEDQFLALTTEFEASKGLILDQNHQLYGKWRSTHYVFSVSASDHAALQSLRSVK